MSVRAAAGRRPRRWQVATGVLLAVGLLAALPGSAAGARDEPLGLLLVARERLADPHFRQTVVLVTRHRHGAPVGVVLNRPTSITLDHAFPEYPALAGRPDRIFAGGPVSPSTLVLVQRSTDRPREALRVLDDVYMSVAGNALADLLGRAPEGETFRVFLGYAGWAPGQLEREIERGDWYVLEPEAEVVFERDPRTLWQELVDAAQARTRRDKI